VELLEASDHRLVPLVEAQLARAVRKGLRHPIEHRVAEDDPRAPKGPAVVPDLEIGDPAPPGGEILRRGLRVELLPHDQADLLQQVLGIRAMGQQRQNIGEDPPLGLEELGEEELSLRSPLRIVQGDVAGITDGSMFALAAHGNLLKATVHYKRFNS
jgi:hypothetical protein